MTALALTFGRRNTAPASLTWDLALVALGSFFVAALAQLSISLLPFSPVPITGQTLAVLLVGASLGALRGVASLLLYLAWGTMGLPFFAEGSSGIEFLRASSATGGYLWGFVDASGVVGHLAQRGWDRSFASAIGAMLIGEVIIFTPGVTWLFWAISVPAAEALEVGLYPFVVGDVIKLLMAAVALPTSWRLVRRVGPRQAGGHDNEGA
jgi:biotin transport system substrate-specific component